MTKIAINGFGRIGRMVFRIIHERKNFEVVAINDLTDTRTLANLLRFDSVHGRFKGKVEYDDQHIIVDGQRIRVYAEKDPENLPYKEIGVEYVIESTGVFRHKAKLEKHLKAGAKKVILTAPAKDEVKTIVLGVNDSILNEEDKVISNASCTTNCFAPIVKVLDQKFGIKTGFMNTIHAFTNDQRVLDLPHKDLRRSRAAAINTIPTTTGAAKAVELVYPEVKGKLDGVATRVPVPDGSLVDFTFVPEKKITIEAINEAIKGAARGDLKGIIEYSDEELVSSDIIGSTYSSIFDSKLTKVLGNGYFGRVVAWYDNEFGYSNRVVDLAEKFFK